MVAQRRGEVDNEARFTCLDANSEAQNNMFCKSCAFDFCIVLIGVVSSVVYSYSLAYWNTFNRCVATT
jgi:hypothetical protein